MTQPSNVKKSDRQWQSQWGSGYIAISKMRSNSAEVTARNFIRFAKIHPKSKILDLGCGHGRITELLVKQVSGLDIVGIDMTRELLDNFAIKSGENDCKLQLMQINVDEEGLPFADGEFDAVISSRVFHYLRDPIAGLVKARRIVKPGGNVAISIPNKWNPVKYLTYHRANLYSPFEVADWFKASGFQNITIRTMCFLPSSIYWHSLANTVEFVGELPGLGMLGGNVLVCGSA